MRRRVFRSVVVAIFASAVLGGPASNAQTSDSLGDERLAASAVKVRVATFNVLKASTRGRSWVARRRTAVSLLRDLDPDVLALQESWASRYDDADKFPALDLANRLRLQMAMTRRTYRPPDAPPEDKPRPLIRTTTGQYLLFDATRFQQVDGGEIALRRQRNHLVTTVWARLQVKATGERFVVANSHLTHGKSKRAQRMRRVELRRLITAFQRAGLDRETVVQAGDFNAPTGTVAGAMGKAALANSLISARKVKNGNFDTFNRLQRRALRSGRHIDQIWVPRGLTVRSWKQGVRQRKGRYVGRFPSDHNPIVAAVELP